MLVFVATKRRRRLGECLGNKHLDKIVSSCPGVSRKKKGNSAFKFVTVFFLTKLFLCLESLKRDQMPG